MRYYTIHEVSEMTGVSEQVLREWEKIGKFKPHHISKYGHRYYSEPTSDVILKKGLIADIANTDDSRKAILKRLIRGIANGNISKVFLFFEADLSELDIILLRYIACLYDCKIDAIGV